jgi:hypothetical protein
MASCWGKEVYLDPISDFHDPRQETFNNPNLGSVKRCMNPSVLGDMRLWDGSYWAYSWIAAMGSEDEEKSGRRKKRASALGKGQPADCTEDGQEAEENEQARIRMRRYETVEWKVLGERVRGEGSKTLKRRALYVLEVGPLARGRGAMCYVPFAMYRAVAGSSSPGSTSRHHLCKTISYIPRITEESQARGQEDAGRRRNRCKVSCRGKLIFGSRSSC